jgi:hypothetical protein
MSKSTDAPQRQINESERGRGERPKPDTDQQKLDDLAKAHRHRLPSCRSPQQLRSRTGKHNPMLYHCAGRSPRTAGAESTKMAGVASLSQFIC